MSLAVTAAGEAFALWTVPTNPGNYDNVDDAWGAHFTPGGGWESPTFLGHENQRAEKPSAPAVAVDGAGNAYVLWIQRQSGSPVWMTRYETGSGWQPAVAIGGVLSGYPQYPVLAASANGQVLAALWTLSNSSFTSGPIWSSFLAIAGRQLVSTSPAGRSRFRCLSRAKCGGRQRRQLPCRLGSGHVFSVQ